MSDATGSATGAAVSELQQLIAAWETIGPNARKILLQLAGRLVIGKTHGDFTAPHDWDRETAEEELDGAIYRAAKLLKLGASVNPGYQGPCRNERCSVRICSDSHPESIRTGFCCLCRDAGMGR